MSAVIGNLDAVVVHCLKVYCVRNNLKISKVANHALYEYLLAKGVLTTTPEGAIVPVDNTVQITVRENKKPGRKAHVYNPPSDIGAVLTSEEADQIFIEEDDE